MKGFYFNSTVTRVDADCSCAEWPEWMVFVVMKQETLPQTRGWARADTQHHSQIQTLLHFHTNAFPHSQLQGSQWRKGSGILGQ